VPEGRGSVQQNKRPQVIVALNGGKSLCVLGQVEDVPVRFLIDTGSTITIVSPTVYKRMQSSSSLEEVSFDVVQADGNSIDVLGLGHFEITVGPLRVVHPVIVGGLAFDGIIGMDYLTNNECKIDLKNQVLKIYGSLVPLWKEGEGDSACRITVKEDVLIPGCHEKLIQGLVMKKGAERMLNIVEGTEEITSRYGLLVGRSLADISRGKVLVRAMNPTVDDVILHAGTNIAVCQPVEEVITNLTLNEESEIQKRRSAKLNACYTNPTSLVPDYLRDLCERSSTHLNDGQKASLSSLLCMYKDIFARDDMDLGRTDKVMHTIDTGDAKPIRQRPRRVPMHLQKEAKEQVEKLLQNGLIEPSTSPWASPVVLVKKKDGSWRHCIDYRALNNVTKKDAYSLPNISQTFDSLQGAKWFSTLDFCSGYLQVEVDPRDREKTAFVTREGLWQYRVMPFGLCNAVSTYERLMEHIFSGLVFDAMLIYIDDLIVFAKSWEEELQRLELVFQRIRDAKLKLKPKKCSLFQKEVLFLGHIVNEEGIATDESKIEAVKNWPIPKTVSECRSFLGFCSYYRKFIKDFSSIASPISHLTKKQVEYCWTDECMKAFQELKNTS
jgi:hypothetical protein